MAINFNVLKQGLPNFSGENLIQTALQGRGQNLSAMGNALQIMQQGNNRVANAATQSRALEQAQLGRQQQGNQFNRDLDLRTKMAVASNRNQQNAQQQQQNALQEQQRQFNVKIDLSRQKQEKEDMFAQAYSSGNAALMFALDPERAQKIQAGNQDAILDVQKAQTDAQDKTAKQEQSLRKEYLDNTGDFRDIAESFAGVQGIKKRLKDPNIRMKTQDQTALIYKVAKLLDPGGRVTDGDYNTVSGNSNVPGWVQSMLAKTTSNRTLSEEQEDRLLALAEGQFKQAKVGFDKQKDIYGKLAEDQGLDPKRVAIDFTNPGTKGDVSDLPAINMQEKINRYNMLKAKR